MASRATLFLVFLLGASLTFAALRLLPPVRLTPPDPANLTLVVPAVATDTYTYRQTRGFMAVLRSEEGRQLEFPRMWLPGEAQVGDTFVVRTLVQPGKEGSDFNVAIKPAP